MVFFHRFLPSRFDVFCLLIPTKPEEEKMSKVKMVLEEIVQSEKKYVKTLNAIVEVS